MKLNQAYEILNAESATLPVLEQAANVLAGQLGLAAQWNEDDEVWWFINGEEEVIATAESPSGVVKMVEDLDSLSSADKAHMGITS